MAAPASTCSNGHLSKPSQLLAGYTGWTWKRLRGHLGNVDVVRQEIASAALVTVRFATPPVQHLQSDFGRCRQLAKDACLRACLLD